MANYPQLDNASGVWNLREVYDAVMGGYWPNANSIALVGCGNAPTTSKDVQQFNLTSGGQATTFGNLSTGRQAAGSIGSFTRCLFTGGANPSYQNNADYAEFSTQGNFADFGDLTQNVTNNSGSGNSTRGLRLGGYISPSNAFTNTV